MGSRTSCNSQLTATLRFTHMLVPEVNDVLIEWSEAMAAHGRLLPPGILFLLLVLTLTSDYSAGQLVSSCQPHGLTAYLHLSLSSCFLSCAGERDRWTTDMSSWYDFFFLLFKTMSSYECAVTSWPARETRIITANWSVTPHRSPFSLSYSWICVAHWWSSRTRGKEISGASKRRPSTTNCG